VSVRRGPSGGRAEIAASRSSAGYDGPSASAASPGRPRAVRHPLFGEGRVEAVEGEGTDRKIIARFPGYGVKKILVRAVRMEIIE